MEELAQQFAQVVRDGGIYTLNGFLVIMYALIAQWALVLSLLCACGVLILDRLNALQTSLSGRPAAATPAHGARVTLIVLVLWIVVALSVPMPVPALGLMMWIATLIASWLIPARRVRTLWQGKMALLMYALTNIGLLLFTQLTSNLSSAEWAALLGSAGTADAAIAQSKNIVQTVATIAIWYALPIGFIAWLLKEFALNAGSMVAPGKTASEVIYAIRTRGGRAE